MLLLFLGTAAYADEPPEIYLDGEQLYTETACANYDGHVLVPMRAIFEALGAEVSWNGDAKEVWASREGEFISVNLDKGTIASGVFNSDGEPYWVETLHPEVPAVLVEGYTYVPVRVISETLGAYVTWDGEANRVLIDSRSDIGGTVYYASDSDFQYLYCVGKNGRNRRKLSDRQVKELEMMDGYVYYLDQKNDYLCRASWRTGEEVLFAGAANKVRVEDGYIYFQELDGGKKSGVLFRMNAETLEIERMTDGSVQYPEKYRDYVYFTKYGSNLMYALTLDGTRLYTVDTGDSVFSKLYPFNCIFYGDYILIEDGVWFGDIMRCNLDGSDMTQITKINALIEKNQQHDEHVIYKQPDRGQDIYCINIDGTDNHLVHKGNPLWLDVSLEAQWGDYVYYKHPMRQEVYRVNIDGSNNRYIGYADEIQVQDGRLFISFLGVYTGNLDGTDMTLIYPNECKGLAVIGDYVYIKDNYTSKLILTDMHGRYGAVTCDACGEWVQCDY